jgi:hypothetical protein
VTLSDKYELLAGAVSYRALAAGAVPWLGPALTASDPARARLHRWVAGGGLRRVPAIDTELVYLGDEAVRPVVVRVLEQIAPPVRDHVLDTAWVLAIGRRAAGQTMAAPLLPPRGGPEVLGLILVDGRYDDTALAAIIAHEAAHLWLEHRTAAPPPKIARALQAVGWALATEGGEGDALLERLLAAERRAAALTAAWGFHGSAADVGHCARARRDHFLADLAAARAARNGGHP